MNDPQELRTALCDNCDHWREEHYYEGGEWRGDEIGCSEYLGVKPDKARVKKRESETAYLYEGVVEDLPPDA